MKKNTVLVFAVMITVSLIGAPVFASAEVSASNPTETPIKKAHVTFVAVKRDLSSASSSSDVSTTTKLADNNIMATGTLKAKEMASSSKPSNIKKVPVKKAVVKKAPVKKAPIKKTPAKKATPVKAPIKKAN